MKTYIVTGHAGFIGSQLARKLIENGNRVIGVDNLTNYYPLAFKIANLNLLKNLEGDFHHYEFDINDAKKMNSTFANFDLSGIFHLAGQPGVRASWNEGFADYAINNIVATQRIFDFAKGQIPVVFASSSSVYGNASSYPVSEKDSLNPISPYGLTKKNCEELASIYQEQFGLKSVALRYFTVYGPGQRPDMAFTKICSSFMTKKPFEINGDGTQIRDFTFVEDIVAATISAMTKPSSSVYNVGGGKEISLNQVINLFESVTGKKLNKKYISNQAGDVIKTGADTNLLTSDTGWTSKVSILEGIQRQWEWAQLNSDLFLLDNR